MLHEITHLRQSNRSLIKRWFTSLDFDLFIWYHKNTPVKFQLAYDKRSNEHAISWDFHQGFRHYSVDSGEDDLSQYKRTPILNNASHQKHLTTLARDFLVASENIDIGVSDFIYSRLMAYQVVPARHNVVHIDHSAASRNW